MRVAEPQPKPTDSIPRAAIQQLVDAVVAIQAEGGSSTFEQVRRVLHRRSARRAPGSHEAMWTVARDVLSELQKLNLATVGTLPRKRSEVRRLRDSPCELTHQGRELALVVGQSTGRAFDQLLVTWVNEHPYFRAFMLRLLEGALHVPDITTLKQIGAPSADEPLLDRILSSCITRLKAVSFANQKQSVFESVVQSRVADIRRQVSLGELDAKRWIDLVEDFVVIPSLLAAENLPFDAVTFQQLIRVSQEFLSASWTSSHPDFEGRLIFATCHFESAPAGNLPKVEKVIHHGRSYASERFGSTLSSAYKRLAGSGAGYVDAYQLRALVCTEIKIQPVVFAHCLEDTIRAGDRSGMTVFTELPFSPPPGGEQYVEIGSRRIGLVKILETAEAPSGA